MAIRIQRLPTPIAVVINLKCLPLPSHFLQTHARSGATYAVTHIPIKTIRGPQNGSSRTNRESGWINHWETGSFAFLSTSALVAVAEGPRVHTVTPAPCAATRLMDALDAPSDKVFPIVTILKAGAWEAALQDAGVLDEFIDVPEGLRRGFLSGLANLAHRSQIITTNQRRTRNSLLRNTRKRLRWAGSRMVTIPQNFTPSLATFVRLPSQLSIKTEANNTLSSITHTLKAITALTLNLYQTRQPNNKLSTPQKLPLIRSSTLRNSNVLGALFQNVIY